MRPGTRWSSTLWKVRSSDVVGVWTRLYRSRSSNAAAICGGVPGNAGSVAGAHAHSPEPARQAFSLVEVSRRSRSIVALAVAFEVDAKPVDVAHEGALIFGTVGGKTLRGESVLGEQRVVARQEQRRDHCLREAGAEIGGDQHGPPGDPVGGGAADE